MNHWDDFVYQKPLSDAKEAMIANHPDKNPGNAKAEMVYRWAQSVRGYVPQKIKNKYVLDSFLGSGDVSDVYRSGENIVKISTVKGGDVLLKNEWDNIAHVRSISSDVRSRGMIVDPVETFVMSDGFKKRVCVYRSDDGFLSLKRLKELKTNVDPVHIAWIFRRLLEAIDVLHRSAIIHGSVLPQHILINPKTHGGKIIGLTHSSRSGIITSASGEFLDWLPPEFKKKKATPQSDVYMLAKTMIWLGSCPDPMLRFFQRCSGENPAVRGEPQKLYEEFGDVLRNLYGKRQFIQLEV